MKTKLNEIMKRTGIEIRTIKSYEQIREAATIIVKTNRLSRSFRESGEKSCEIMLQEDPRSNPLVGYIAYIGNKPVAVSSVFYGGGVAGIYNVGTLKKFQHRGIGTAITIAPLIDAQKREFEIAILTATTQGFPVYKRIGFNKLHVLDQYFWVPQRFRRFLFKIYFQWQLKKHNNS
jgi:ribosomal protein S18 acetylase RimI-like enzyme